jgi:hypothetical protein
VCRGHFTTILILLKGFAMFKNKRNLGLGLGLGFMVMAGSASAAIDVAPVVAQLSEGEAAVAAIGAAILVVWAIKKVYSLIGGR